mgnify:CR=1 FL=1
MSNKKEKFARFGIATKGAVYIIIGVLAVLAAVGQGGEKTGSSGALDQIASAPFGQALLILTGIGLLGYMFWRFYQAFSDSENNGEDAKGIFIRIGFVISGIVYGALAYTAFSTVIGALSSGSGGGKESMVSTLLNKPYGQYIVGFVAICLLIKAGFQFYLAFSEKYKEKVESSGLKQEAQSILLKAGKIGFTARGVVIALITYFTFQAALNSNSDKAGGTKQALNFLENEFGSVVLIVVAFGLAAYGVFMFIRAKYSQLNIN